jgi:hypothetical protein
VIDTLDNYRSLGSVFSLRQSILYTYLPSFDHSIPSSMIPHPIPISTSFNNHRIDLTPGVLVPSRRSSSSYKHYPKMKSISKRSKSVRTDHQSLVHHQPIKISREHLSHQLTEFIQMNHI